MKNYLQPRVVSAVIALVLLLSFSTHGQSGDRENPTPVTGPEISGRIAARDLGDSRVTTHYYVFISNPGDTSLELSLSNFTGDIDVFDAEQLKQKTKVTIFPGMEKWETSRMVYSRQRERLLIRIEGRTPNDEPAVYKIKLSGAWEVLPPSDQRMLEMPVVRKAESGVTKVNSVGTILDKPDRDPAPSTKTASEPISLKTEEAEVANTSKRADPKPWKMPKSTTRSGAISKSPGNAESMAKGVSKERSDSESKKQAASEVKRKSSARADSLKSPSEPMVSESVATMRILLKNGGNIELPMSRVREVRIDRGALKVTTNDGTLRVIQMKDIAKMGIE